MLAYLIPLNSGKNHWPKKLFSATTDTIKQEKKSQTDKLSWWISVTIYQICLAAAESHKGFRLTTHCILTVTEVEWHVIFNYCELKVVFLEKT